jgi:hypothetical protein
MSDEELEISEAKILDYNFAQVLFLYAQQKYRFLEWGRGTGKSTILGKYIIDCVTQLPRSSGVLVGETYQSIKTRTLPSTIAGMEQHGIYKNQHFHVGERPPAHLGWIEPYEPPLDYRNCIIFWNGTVLHFLSQDAGAGSGRGMNVDWVVGDEAARLDETKFMNDVVLTNRGNKFRKAEYPDGTWRHFKDCPLHHSVVLASTTPVTTSGQWVLKYEKLAEQEPDKYVFIRASAFLNKHNLGKDYFLNAKRIMPAFMYDAEVRNIRMKKIEDGFYPRFDEKRHTYNSFDSDYYLNLELGSNPNCLGDKDLQLNEPLHVSLDWGARINCLSVAQTHPGELRFVKSMFVKSPSILQDLINDHFIPYYKPMLNRVIYLWYDATGNYEQANSRLTYAQEVKQLLHKAGFNVELMTRGISNESHEDKYLLWSKLLEEQDERLPKVRFNKSNCFDLVVSISNAPAKRGLKVAIQKNKGSEKNQSIAQEHATHLSDTADIIVSGLYMRLMKAGFRQAIPNQIR